MCYEQYDRRRREAEESRKMWRDFERAEPVLDPDPPDEVSEPERAEAREPAASRER